MGLGREVAPGAATHLACMAGSGCRVAAALPSTSAHRKHRVPMQLNSLNSTHRAAVRLSTSSMSTNTSVSGSSTTSCASKHSRKQLAGRILTHALTGKHGEVVKTVAAINTAAQRQSGRTESLRPLLLKLAPPAPAACLDLGKQAADQLAALAEPLGEEGVCVHLHQHAALGEPAHWGRWQVLCNAVQAWITCAATPTGCC